MSRAATQQHKTFRKRLEEAIAVNKKIACPNRDCDNMIVSKEVILSSNQSKVEYQCRNPHCNYHAPRYFVKQVKSAPSAVSDTSMAQHQSLALQLQRTSTSSLILASLVVVAISACLGFVMNLIL